MHQSAQELDPPLHSVHTLGRLDVACIYLYYCDIENRRENRVFTSITKSHCSKGTGNYVFSMNHCDTIWRVKTGY
jgi:hypothetical protein